MQQARALAAFFGNAVFKSCQQSFSRDLAHHQRIAEGDDAEQVAPGNIARGQGSTHAAAIAQGHLAAKGAGVFQHGVSDEAAPQTVVLPAGVYAVRQGKMVAAHLVVAEFVQAGGILLHQSACFCIARFRGSKLPCATVPAERNALCVKNDIEFAQILRGTLGSDHQYRLPRGGTLDNGVRAFFGIRAQIAVAVAAHDDVHAVHAAGQLSVFGQADMGEGDDVLHALRFQIPDRPLQAGGRILEKCAGAGGGQAHHLVVGYAHHGHLLPAYREQGVGSIVALEHGAALCRLQIGCQHGKGEGCQKARQLQTAFVEFVVAQCHGVVRHVLVQLGQHGPLVHAVEKGPLELVAGIQGDDIVVLRLGRADGGGDAGQPAAAIRVIEAGIAVLVDARDVGMGIVGMQDGQGKSAFRRGGMPRG